MTKAGTKHTEQQYLDWVSRMDLGVEELGYAGNDAEWESFVYDKFTDKLGAHFNENMFDSWLDMASEIHKAAGYKTEYVEIRGVEQRIFRDYETGQFISADAAWAKYSDFIYKSSFPIIP